MKIALLSFHNAYNYGAALQAIGLQKALENMGVQCEYIDYQNKHRSHAYDLKYQCKSSLKKGKLIPAARAMVGIPFMSKRSKAFDSFYEQHLKKTARTYHRPEELRELNSSYDKFIVGSDQVWNFGHNGRDTAYFLEFVEDDAKKISYSSSFGLSDLPEELADTYATFLGKFNRLATRESIGTEIIKKTTGRKSHLVLDPVFLAGKDEWEKLRVANRQQGRRYIFFYTNRDSQIQDFLNTGYVTDEEFHVLSTHLTPKELIDRRIKTRISMSPGEFLEEIHTADLVVTASFHCLAFSIIYHKPFAVFLTGDHGKDERITNLLKITGLENRIVTSETSQEDILIPIDYAEVDRRLKDYLEASKEYLRRAVFDEPDIPFDVSMQNNMFCQDSRCTGCGACAAACPCQAITMKGDADGFLTPVIIDEKKCIKCDKCHSVCQVYAEKKRVENQHYFAVKNRDEIRAVSSSGGVFRALAERMFFEGGVVCAAGMDKDFRVYHMFATNMEELQPMCGTYYVQSDLRDVYKRVKEYLIKKRKVLFVGTACQVAGLNHYIGKKDENLVTCDILCHGVPSPKVFERFIEYLRTKGELSDFKFRDKRLGWKGYHVSAVINGAFVKDKLWLQSFNNLFSHNMINRLACGSCQYTNYDRPGDITIGDFWGLKRNHPDFIDQRGVSLVMTNTVEGQRVFEQLDFMEVRSVEKRDTVQNSLKKPSTISSKRLQVFQCLARNGYEKTARVYAEVNVGGMLKNYVRRTLLKVKIS